MGPNNIICLWEKGLTEADYFSAFTDCELTEAFLERPVVFDVEKQVLHRGVCYRALTVKDDGKVATVEAAQPMSFRPFEDEFPALVSPSQQAGVIPVAQTQPCRSMLYTSHLKLIVLLFVSKSC